MRPPFNPAELLRQADAVLRSRQPTSSADFYACDGYAFRARFDYPGVVSVYDHNTGDLLACSRPGKPTHLARTKRAAP